MRPWRVITAFLMFPMLSTFDHDARGPSELSYIGRLTGCLHLFGRLYAASCSIGPSYTGNPRAVGPWIMAGHPE
jgi:hypothetical protein